MMDVPTTIEPVQDGGPTGPGQCAALPKSRDNPRQSERVL
jgi:hypothetical protein